MNAFGHDLFWNKARVFVNRALEEPPTRSEDERRLWAALALEVLAKWALSATSPTLVVDPATAGGDQLLRAVGVLEGGPYVTVSATTAYKRCARIYKPFDEKRAERFAQARNEYLHGPDIGLLNLPSEPWWEQYWSLVDILLAAHRREIVELVGPAHVSSVEEHLARNERRLKSRFEALVEAARRNLERYRSSMMTAQEAARWERWTVGAGLKYYDTTECPACKSDAVVEADNPDEVRPSFPEYYEDGVTTLVTFTPEYLSCENCHLILDSYELIEAGNLDFQFEVHSDDLYYEEPEYGND